MHAWDETDDPYLLVARLLPHGGRGRLDDHMWAAKVLALRGRAAGDRPARWRPGAARAAHAQVGGGGGALRAAGAAIDAVHAQVRRVAEAGPHRAEVGRDIADAIIAEGHATVDFVIVGSGPNGASPHHELSDRVIRAGEPVVVDIGGAMPSGYCSDSTRTYAVGEPRRRLPRALRRCCRRRRRRRATRCRPGVTAGSVDAAARDVIEAAGYGELFMHRTGHGIGLETHEDPYIVAGNATAARAGHGVLDRAGDLPGGPARRAHRGHRRRSPTTAPSGST